MFNKVSQSFGIVANTFSHNSFILPRAYKCAIPQLKLSIQIYGLIARGYSTENPSALVSRKYDEIHKHELNELLKDPKNKAMYDKLKLELEHIRSYVGKIPNRELTAYNWLYLMQTSRGSQRRHYLEFLWKLEKKIENREAKKILKQMSYEEKLTQDNDSPYGLNKCTLFHRIRDSTIMHFYNARLINAMLYEPSIVFDLGYEASMTPYEQQNCAKQLLLAFSENRSHDQPFNLHFCNANRDGSVMQKLHKLVPNLYDPEFPLNISSQSYLDLFDKKQLVYLTPHTNEIMTKFNPKLVYVIGAMVDKVNPKPLSFQKARKDGIKMMRLPLGEKLQWGTGSTKNLPLNHVLSILLDLRHSNDWMLAFKHVPKRKLKAARLLMMQKQISFREKQIANFALSE